MPLLSNVTMYQHNLIHRFLGFCLVHPNGRDLRLLNTKSRKFKDMYQKVFGDAMDFGREQDLFGLTKDPKKMLDATQAYLEVLDEKAFRNGCWSTSN